MTILDVDAAAAVAQPGVLQVGPASVEGRFPQMDLNNSQAIPDGPLPRQRVEGH